MPEHVLMPEIEISPTVAAHDLDVAESMLRRWMRQLTATPSATFPSNAKFGRTWQRLRL